MKKHIGSISISRREALKDLTIFGALSFMSGPLFSRAKKEPTVHFVGLGGAGSKMVEYIYNKDVKGQYTCIANFKSESMPKDFKFFHFEHPDKVQIENANVLGGISKTNLSYEIPKHLIKIFDNSDFIFLFSGLGGSTGTFLTERLAWYLSEQNKPFRVISSIPFVFEKQRRISAQKSIYKLKNLDHFFCWYDLNQVAFVYGYLTIPAAFEKAHEGIYNLYKSTIAQQTKL